MGKLRRPTAQARLQVEEGCKAGLARHMRRNGYCSRPFSRHAWLKIASTCTTHMRLMGQAIVTAPRQDGQQVTASMACHLLCRPCLHCGKLSQKASRLYCGASESG